MIKPRSMKGFLGAVGEIARKAKKDYFSARVEFIQSKNGIKSEYMAYIDGYSWVQADSILECIEKIKDKVSPKKLTAGDITL